MSDDISEDELKRAIGPALRAARVRAGLSQPKLATAMGSDVKTVGRIERGEFLPSLPTLMKLARHVGASLDQLTGLMQPVSDGAAGSRSTAAEPTPDVVQMNQDLRALAAEVARLRDLVESSGARDRRSAG